MELAMEPRTGDKIRRINGKPFTSGDEVVTISRIGSNPSGKKRIAWLEETETSIPFEEVLNECKIVFPNNPHVHAALIHMWAEGAEIEIRGKGLQWSLDKNPTWNTSRQYRVKPCKTKAEIEREAILKEIDALQERLDKMKVLD